MASYPSGVYAPRTKENKPGVVYTESKATITYAEDVTKLDDEVVAVETELGTEPKGSSADVAEKIKGFKTLAGADADVVTVKNGNVGINQNNPACKLHLTDGAILAEGTTGGTPASGAGTRLMWVPAKKAFRSGMVVGTEWDDANIGNASFATGNACIASSVNTFAQGSGAEATGAGAFAQGTGVRSTGVISFAVGQNVEATGNYSFVAGNTSYVYNTGSLAIGMFLKATADYAMVIGKGAGSPPPYRFINNVANSLMVGFNTTIPTLFVGSGSGAGTTGRIGIGTATPATSAATEIYSTTGALLLPRMTTGQRDALTAVNGMILYNSTLNQTQTYENGAWRQV